jgi:predicted nucleotidyltransferase
MMNTDEIQFPDTPFPVCDHLAILARRGSEAHGLYIAPDEPMGTDDRDLMGVVIPPSRFYVGLTGWSSAESIKGCWDVVLYELRKFVGLLLKQNPNVIGCLWLEPEDYLHLSNAGRTLIRHRAAFLSRGGLHNAFVGYAWAQFRKMEKSAFNGYMGEKRRSVVEQFGYDTKNATHLIRLLRMGRETLTTGRMQVKRTIDRDELIAIKRGALKLDEVKAVAKQEFELCEAAYKTSSLPEECDAETAEEIVQSVILDHLNLEHSYFYRTA